MCCTALQSKRGISYEGIHTLTPWEDTKICPINEHRGLARWMNWPGENFKKAYCLREHSKTFTRTHGCPAWPAGPGRGSNAYCSRFRQQMGGKSLNRREERRGEERWEKVSDCLSSLSPSLRVASSQCMLHHSCHLCLHRAVPASPFTWLHWLHVFACRRFSLPSYNRTKVLHHSLIHKPACKHHLK